MQPESFFDELGAILKEIPPLPGEEALYANIQSVLDAASKDPKLHAALIASAVDADKNLVAPLFQFHNSGLPLPYNRTTINNGAAFGTDYYSRAAVAKSNIFVNSVRETKYFYQDSDAAGQQLSGNHAYSVTFASDQLQNATRTGRSDFFKERLPSEKTVCLPGNRLSCHNVGHLLSLPKSIEPWRGSRRYSRSWFFSQKAKVVHPSSPLSVGPR